MFYPTHKDNGKNKWQVSKVIYHNWNDGTEVFYDDSERWTVDLLSSRQWNVWTYREGATKLHEIHTNLNKLVKHIQLNKTDVLLRTGVFQGTWMLPS